MAVSDSAGLLDLRTIPWLRSLFARFNVTVTLALLVGALSVSGAIFLILELSTPYSGLMQISDAPLRHALTQISG
jgi:hypothetical protein